MSKIIVASNPLKRIPSGSRPILTLTPCSHEIRRGFFETFQMGSDELQFIKNGTQHLLRSGRRGVQDFNSNFLDPENILLIASVLRIELPWIEWRIEIARIGICISIHRCTRSIQGLLNIINTDERFRMCHRNHRLNTNFHELIDMSNARFD